MQHSLIRSLGLGLLSLVSNMLQSTLKYLITFSLFITFVVFFLPCVAATQWLIHVINSISSMESIFSNQIVLNLMMLARSKDAYRIFSMFTSCILCSDSRSFAHSTHPLYFYFYLQRSIIPAVISIRYWRPRLSGDAAVAISIIS